MSYSVHLEYSWVISRLKNKHNTSKYSIQIGYYPS